MNSFAANVEARRLALLAAAECADKSAADLVAFADALRRHAGQLEAFPHTPATGQPTVPNLSNQPTKFEAP